MHIFKHIHQTCQRVLCLCVLQYAVVMLPSIAPSVFLHMFVTFILSRLSYNISLIVLFINKSFVYLCITYYKVQEDAIVHAQLIYTLTCGFMCSIKTVYVNRNPINTTSGVTNKSTLQSILPMKLQLAYSRWKMDKLQFLSLSIQNIYDILCNLSIYSCIFASYLKSREILYAEIQLVFQSVHFPLIYL